MRICIACGKTDDKVYFTKAIRDSGTIHTCARCSECQWKRRVRVRNGTAKPLTKPPQPKFARGTAVEVVSCPNNEFPRGSRFIHGDFKKTLMGGFWTLGMIVLINEKKYAVCGNGVVMRTFKKLGFPFDIRLSPQWLAEIGG